MRLAVLARTSCQFRFERRVVILKTLCLRVEPEVFGIEWRTCSFTLIKHRLRGLHKRPAERRAFGKGERCRYPTMLFPMTQTIYALLALAMLSLLTVTQQSAILSDYRTMLSEELEIMGSGVALQVMEYIATKAFDEQSTEGGTISSTSDLSTAPFSTNRDCAFSGTGDACDDLDDFHQMQPEYIDFVIGTDTVQFEVNASVTYLDSNRNSTNTRTYLKEVTVEVQDYWGNGKAAFMKQPIRLARMFSYPE